MLSTTCSGWRRDLLVSFVASALTMTVLVPWGWVLLRQEQQQAVAETRQWVDSQPGNRVLRERLLARRQHLARG